MSDEAAYKRLREVEAQIKELKDERAELINVLAPVGNADYYDDINDVTVQVAVVRRYRPVVNLVRLEERDPQLYEQITKRVVDSRKLNDTLDAGAWPEDLVADVITIAEDNPFLKFTEKVTTS